VVSLGSSFLSLAWTNTHSQLAEVSTSCSWPTAGKKVHVIHLQNSERQARNAHITIQWLLWITRHISAVLQHTPYYSYSSFFCWVCLLHAMLIKCAWDKFANILTLKLLHICFTTIWVFEALKCGCPRPKPTQPDGKSTPAQDSRAYKLISICRVTYHVARLQQNYRFLRFMFICRI